MAKVKLILLIALLGLTVSTIVLFVRGGRLTYNPVEIADALPQNVDMQLTGVNFTEVTQAGREWSMKADTLHYFRAKDLMVLDQVRATFQSKDGPMHISGRKGYYNKTTKIVRLVGQVRASDPLGRRLSTEEVRFDVSTSVLQAPGYFELTGPQLNLAGQGLSVFTRDNRIKVSEQAMLVVRPTGT